MRYLALSIISFIFGVSFIIVENKFLLFFAFLFLSIFILIKKDNERILNKLLCLFFFLFGIFHSNCFCNDVEYLKKSLSFYIGNKIKIYGKAKSFYISDRTVKIIFEAEKIKVKNKKILFRRKVRLLTFFLKKDFDFQNLYDYGYNFEIEGILSKIDSPKNPLVFSYSESLANSGIFFKIEKPKILKKYVKKSFSISNFAIYLKSKIFFYINKNHSDLTKPIIMGILFGDKSLFTEEHRLIFEKTGTLHILAASGFHISVITLSFLFILKRFKASSIISFFILLPVLLLYMNMAGESPSILRAGIMALLSLISVSLNREYDLISSLCFAIGFLIFINPFHLLNCSFLLSASAILGIIFYLHFINKIVVLNFKFPLNKIIELCFLSISIESVTLPISVLFFCQWTPFSFLSNIIATPLASLILFLGFLEPIFNILSPINEFIVFLMISLLKFLSLFKFSQIFLCSPSIYFVFLYYTIFFICSYFDFFTKKIKNYFLYIPIIFILYFVSYSLLIPYFFKPPKSMEVIFFSIGNADSSFIMTPNGKKILIDCGTSGIRKGIDVGKNVIAPYLLKSGIDSIDYVFITHEHEDHLGGLYSLSKRVKIKKVFASKFVAGKFLGLEKADSMMSGDILNISDDTKIQVLSPSDNYFYNDENSKSLVLNIVYGQNSILYCADIDIETERKILNSYDVKCDVLKIAHHGSITSSSDEFLKNTNAKIAIISCDRGDITHPAKSVLERLNKYGIKYYKTDELGAVKLILDKNGGIDYIK